jgi:tetratricopeptide (TPR) repeat protein
MKPQRILIAAFAVLCAGAIALAAIKLPGPSPRVLVAKAQIDASLGKLDKAERTLQKAAKLAPEHASTHLKLSRVLLRQQAFTQSLASYHKAVALDPLITSSDEFARYVALVSDFEKRLAYLKAFVQLARAGSSGALRPVHLAALHLAGQVRLRSRALALKEAEENLALLAGPRAEQVRRCVSAGKLDAAVEIARELEGTGQAAEDVARQLAEALAHQQAARGLFQSAVVIDANFAPARLALAATDITTGAVQQGTQAVLKLVEGLESPPVNLLTYAARLAMRQGRTADAQALVRQALAKEPGNPHALRLQAAILFSKGEFEQLAHTISKLRRNDPRDHCAMFLEGSIDLIEGRFSRAAQQLALAAAKQKSGQLLQYHLGLAYYRIGAIDRAEQCLQALCERPDVFPEARIARAATALAKGDLDVAETNCRTVLGHNPADPAALRLLAAVHIGRRDADAAIEVLHKYLSVRPKSALAAQALAAAQMAQGRLEAVIAEYQALLEQAPRPEVRHHVLALAHSLAGRPGEAEKHYARLSARDPSLPHVWLLRARMLALDGRVLAAADQCRKALARGASPPAILTARGVFNTILGNYDQARKELAVGPDPYAAGTFAINVYFALARHENYATATARILAADPLSRRSQDLVIIACSAGPSAGTLAGSIDAMVREQPGVLGVLNKAVVMHQREAATFSRLKLINVDSMWARLVGVYKHRPLDWRWHLGMEGRDEHEL